MRAAHMENRSGRTAVNDEIDAAWRDKSPNGDARKRAAYARYRELPEEADAFDAEHFYYATAYAY